MSRSDQEEPRSHQTQAGNEGVTKHIQLHFKFPLLFSARKADPFRFSQKKEMYRSYRSLYADKCHSFCVKSLLFLTQRLLRVESSLFTAQFWFLAFFRKLFSV
jgi:hypothetical protein